MGENRHVSETCLFGRHVRIGRNPLIIKEMRVNNFKVSWGSDDSGRVEIGERVFEVDECKVIDREMFEGDEDEVIKFLLEGGWSEVNELWTPKGRPSTEREI